MFTVCVEDGPHQEVSFSQSQQPHLRGLGVSALHTPLTGLEQTGIAPGQAVVELCVGFLCV